MNHSLSGGQVKVFGSTLYSAIGLRGLIEQKNNNIQFIQDLHIDIAEEVRERMIHGTKHDIDAIATIVAKVLPVYFPNKVFVEEGCYVWIQYMKISLIRLINRTVNHVIAHGIGHVRKKMEYISYYANGISYEVTDLKDRSLQCTDYVHIL
jgi:hypothetical protein